MKMQHTVPALLLVALLAHPSVSSGRERNKSLVLIGGALTSPEIISTIIELAGGRGRARIGIVTAASEPESWDRFAQDMEDARNSRANASYYRELFVKAGALDAPFIPVDLDHIHHNSSPEIVAMVDGQTGFFFGGGDQSRIVETLIERDGTDSPLLRAIRAKYDRGAVVAGTSAGAAVMVGRDRRAKIPMIAAGTSYDALVHGPFIYARYNYVDTSSRDLLYNPNGGLGFFDYGIVDTHFSTRGRQGRSIRLAYDLAVDMVYGIDENTALVVTETATDQASFEVVGENGVWIIDVSEACRVSAVYDDRGAPLFELPYKALLGVRASYLTHEDRYRPGTKTVEPAPWKQPIVEDDTRNRVRSSENIFGRLDFLETALDLLRCPCTTARGRTTERDPSFEVRMAKDPGLETAGYGGKDAKGKWHLSFKNLKIDIYPIVREP